MIQERVDSDLDTVRSAFATALESCTIQQTVSNGSRILNRKFNISCIYPPNRLLRKIVTDIIVIMKTLE